MQSFAVKYCTICTMRIGPFKNIVCLSNFKSACGMKQIKFLHFSKSVVTTDRGGVQKALYIVNIFLTFSIPVSFWQAEKITQIRHLKSTIGLLSWRTGLISVQVWVSKLTRSWLDTQIGQTIQTPQVRIPISSQPSRTEIEISIKFKKPELGPQSVLHARDKRSMANFSFPLQNPGLASSSFFSFLSLCHWESTLADQSVLLNERMIEHNTSNWPTFAALLFVDWVSSRDPLSSTEP